MNFCAWAFKIDLSVASKLPSSVTFLEFGTDSLLEENDLGLRFLLAIDILFPLAVCGTKLVLYAFVISVRLSWQL